MIIGTGTFPYAVGTAIRYSNVTENGTAAPGTWSYAVVERFVRGTVIARKPSYAGGASVTLLNGIAVESVQEADRRRTVMSASEV